MSLSESVRRIGVEPDGQTQAWASFNLPTALRQPIGGTTYQTQLYYGPDHQRWKQVAGYSNGTETTFYVGGLLEKQSSTATGQTYWRHYVDTPSGFAVVSRNSDGSTSTHYAVTDHLGSTDTIIDGAGNAAGKFSYTAFGARRGSDWTSATNPDWVGIANVTRHGFTDHEHLDNVNLIHMNGRVYDSVIGRVLSVDPIIGDLTDSQTINPYAYVGNRPASRTDPTGYVDPATVGTIGTKVFMFVWNSGFNSLLGLGGDEETLPPAGSMPGASAQTGMPMCSAGVMNSPTCGGYVLSVAGVGPSSGGPPTSSWTSQASAEQAATEQENLRRFFEDLAKNAVTVVILAPYHDGKASYDAAQEGRYGAAILYTVFTVCDVGCKHVSLILRPLAKAGGALRAADVAARGLTHWGNPKTLARHFRDHGAEFGAKSADNYARKASDFFRRSQADRLPTKIDADGVIRVYDPKTNTFGAFNPDGTTMTFFRPTSPTYWERQPGSAPWGP